MKVTLLVMTLNEIFGMKVIMPKTELSWYDQLIVLDGGLIAAIIVRRLAGAGLSLVPGYIRNLARQRPKIET